MAAVNIYIYTYKYIYITKASAQVLELDVIFCLADFHYTQNYDDDDKYTFLYTTQEKQKTRLAAKCFINKI